MSVVNVPRTSKAPPSSKCEFNTDNIPIEPAKPELSYEEYIEVDGLILNKLEQSNDLYVCHQCNYATKSKGNLVGHMMMECNNETKANKTTNTPKTFQCDRCDFHTARKSTLRFHKNCAHASNQQNRFYCDHCQYESRTKWKLYLHRITEHLPEDQISRFKCTECTFTTRKKCKLQQHNLETHPKALTAPVYTGTGTGYRCDQCEFETAVPEYLNRHRQFLHFSNTNIYSFDCSIDGASPFHPKTTTTSNE